MKGIHFVSLLLVGMLSLGAPQTYGADPVFKIPEKWIKYVELDQFYNVPIRRDQILNQEKAKTVSIYHFDVPVEVAGVLKSHYLDQSTQDKILIKSDGKTFMRYFIVDRPNTQFAYLNKKFSLKSGRYFGKLMQSHSTYLVFDQEAIDAEPFFVKMQVNDVNGRTQMAGAIKLNDFVESVLAESRDSTISYYPERIGGTLQAGPNSYSILIRNAKLVNSPKESGNMSLPLHGFFGSLVLDKASEKMEMTREEWIQKVYLPKLAVWHAKLNYDYGFYIEGHTQNTLINLDAKTGNINGFGFRDMFDIMVDPVVLEFRGKSVNSAEVVKNGLSVVNMHFVAAKEAKLPGHHFYTYTSQSVEMLTEEGSDEQNMKIYFKHYLQEVEKITGAKMKSYEGFNPPAQFQNIYNQVIEYLLPKLHQRMFNFDQNVIEDIFMNKVIQGNVGFVEKKSYETVVLLLNQIKYGKFAGVHSYRYAFDGKRIYLTETNSTSIIAVAHSLENRDLIRIKGGQPRVRGFGGCVFDNLNP